VHFDFYRLAEAGVIAEELKEFMGDPNYVVVIEWGDIVADVLPADHVRIQIQYKTDTERLIQSTYPPWRTLSNPKMPDAQR
jgi:tRNA A37 threonylcarbamoyladenosine biosynthesis protein TsaE